MTESAEEGKIVDLTDRDANGSGCGCEYCTSPNGTNTDIFDGSMLSVGYGVYRKINYCPMCGRKLR